VGASAVNGYQPYHFDRMEQALGLAPPHGLILDAGCGEGIDLANQARRPGVEVMGVELSEGGCRASVRRAMTAPTASVVQAELCRLPFPEGTFDFVYSYGVLHHLQSPQDGLRELARVLRPGARVAVYLYEDFRERAAWWRWLLVLANSVRWLTTRMPAPVLYRLCQLGSPLLYLTFAVPFQILRNVSGLGAGVSRFPFRHATGPFSLTGDLYDRFATPIERRYSRDEATALLHDAGFQRVTVASARGWMVTGVKAP